MARDKFEDRKLFSVEEANRALPLVRAIATDLAALSREVAERRERLAMLQSGRDRAAGDPYNDELAQIEEELEADNLRLLDYVRELRELGVEPKNGPEGLIDFPTIVDGRPAYLCWKLGEPEVLFWHDLEAGFRGRQPLTAEAGAGGEPLPPGPSAAADE